MIALLNANAKNETSEDINYSPERKAELEEKIRQFNLKYGLDRDRLALDRSTKE
jgi:hypothetical protein